MTVSAKLPRVGGGTGGGLRHCFHFSKTSQSHNEGQVPKRTPQEEPTSGFGTRGALQVRPGRAHRRAEEGKKKTSRSVRCDRFPSQPVQTFFAFTFHSARLDAHGDGVR